MVSNVRYRTFKDFKAEPASVALLTLVLSAVVLLVDTCVGELIILFVRLHRMGDDQYVVAALIKTGAAF